MYENFERIPQPERQHILDACILEFAQKGYIQASTNAIVLRAGIPKGTLFYFFGSKKNLYLYVMDHAVQQYAQVTQPQSNELPGDLFERLLKLGRERMRFALNHPLLYRLFYDAFLNTPEEMKAEIDRRYASYYAPSIQIIIDGLDRLKFKPDIEVEKVIELIFLILDGIQSKYTPVLRRLNPDDALPVVDNLFAECEVYFAMLRQGVYR
jgi:TetR/AcrR family transcriptional regulator